MSRGKKHTAEQIVGKLREAEISISQGQTAASAAKSIGVTAQTYFRWRKANLTSQHLTPILGHLHKVIFEVIATVRTCSIVFHPPSIIS